MNILNRFTLESLKKNKKRTIVTIIGVMLSSALICAVAGMFMSVLQTLIDDAKNRYGDYHIEFQDVPVEEAKYIENNNNVESYFYTYTLGYSKLDNSKNQSKPYVYILGLTNESMSNIGLQLESGRMPENDSELVISKHIRTNGRVDLNVGDTITLNIGKRITKDGTELKQNNPYNQDDSEVKLDEDAGNLLNLNEQEEVEEEIIDTKTKTYTIVGIVERPNYLIETYSAPGYTVFTKANINSQATGENNKEQGNCSIKNIFVQLKNPKDRNEKNSFVESITSTIEKNTGENINVTENAELLRYQGNLSDKSLEMVYSIVGIVIGIIVVSSIFVIRNSFSISVSEKIKQYGMLASIGATSKQIKRSVLFEAFIIGLIGIPLGIICGIIAVVILVNIINALIQGIEEINFVISIPYIAIIFSILISIITIYFSSISSAIRASKIAPIDAVRGSKETKIEARKIKTTKLTKKIFGIGGVIASKNLKRSKKKYRTTVASLIVSITIFVALANSMEFIKKITAFQYTNYKYNFEVDLDSDEIEENIDFYKKIVTDNDINDYSYYYRNGNWSIPSKYSTQDSIRYIKGGQTEDFSSILICKVENNYFKKYMKELGVSGNYKDVAILKNDYKMTLDQKQVVIDIYNIKGGDKIELFSSSQENSKEITISKVTDKGPMGYEQSYAPGMIFVAIDNNLINVNDEGTYLGELYVDSNNPDELEEYLQDIKSEDIKFSNMYYWNLDSVAEQNRRILAIVSIFLYGFITVITLIGVTNIFNTITTNMILRSKEFAMLKSIGMTKKEFNRMIRLESILYGMKSLIIGIPIGIALSYLIYRVFVDSIEFKFYVSVMPIAIAFIFVFIIVGITMKYSLNKINKQNIVETIRNDNI